MGDEDRAVARQTQTGVAQGRGLPGFVRHARGAEDCLGQLAVTGAGGARVDRAQHLTDAPPLLVGQARGAGRCALAPALETLDRRQPAGRAVERHERGDGDVVVKRGDQAGDMGVRPNAEHQVIGVRPMFPPGRNRQRLGR